MAARFVAVDREVPACASTPPDDPHDTTTPVAMAGNRQKLSLGNALSPTSREHRTDWMLDCKTGDNRLRAGLPKDWRIGGKTGDNGRDAFGDIAVTWPTRDEPVVVCVYTRGGTRTPSQVDGVFAAIERFIGMHVSSAV